MSSLFFYEIISINIRVNEMLKSGDCLHISKTFRTFASSNKGTALQGNKEILKLLPFSVR
jgi:hypothetical protein